MGYLIFVQGLGWVKSYYKHKKLGVTTPVFTQDQNEAHIWWTFSGVKRAAKKISIFAEIVEL